MSNYPNFCITFLFLSPISLVDTKTSYQSCIHVWCYDFSFFLFDKAKEEVFNGSWEQIYRTFSHFTYMKTDSLGLLRYEQAEHFWERIEHQMKASECTWMPLSGCEHPLNTHWVHMNANEWVRTAMNTNWVHIDAIECVLTSIECAWMPVCHYWMWLATVWPWERLHLCENWMVPECLQSA